MQQAQVQQLSQKSTSGDMIIPIYIIAYSLLKANMLTIAEGYLLCIPFNIIHKQLISITSLSLLLVIKPEIGINL